MEDELAMSDPVEEHILVRMVEGDVSTQEDIQHHTTCPHIDRKAYTTRITELEIKYCSAFGRTHCGLSNRISYISPCALYSSISGAM